MSEDLSVPSESELHRRITTRLGDADLEEVTAILAAHGLDLTPPLPARRELVVHRLYCEGVKRTGTAAKDGPFTLDIPLGPGPWVIASEINSAGKSSILWALSFALRGEGFPGFRRPETVGWFHYVRADVEVGGVAGSVRLTFERPGRPHARLLSADSLPALLALEGRSEEGPGVRVVSEAEPPEVEALISRFMMDRLGLRPISVWRAEPGAPKGEDGQRDSIEDVHGWSSFFYALALNSANDTILLGPTTVGQLPVRLMQLFLDVPYASELTRLVTARKAELQEESRVARRADEDTRAREQKAEPLRAALADAQQRLRGLRDAQPDISALLQAVERAATKVVSCQEAHQIAADQLEAARKNRLIDQRAARRARQSSAARLLLGALDPEACPRCDHDIDDARRAIEDTDHRCSVCANPLPDKPDDPEAAQAALTRIDNRLAASQAAETRFKAAADQAARVLERARTTYAEATAALTAARSDEAFTLLEQTQNEVFQLQGALTLAAGETTRALPALAAILSERAQPARSAGPQPLTDERVLAVATEVVKEVVDTHSRALFTELNGEILAIAQALGVTNLGSVNLNLAGHLNAIKSGAKHPYASFSPVDRLRMRIAAVVGMVRVGRRRGIASHPGLLLIDAPTADEVVPETAHQVIQTLYDTGNDIPGMQMIITSIESAVWDIFPRDRIVTGVDGRELF
ncbi:ATP-binding protein [Microbispora sp. H10949]|uniref:ATP-binding protein n=1 Tax=Microbispora sp. H10949 TaxID=2729111 RepID=UPI001603FDCD|nr:ATP-binding protein [Microbispora sp. H10949]